jgi:hypothetical protein
MRRRGFRSYSVFAAAIEALEPRRLLAAETFSPIVPDAAATSPSTTALFATPQVSNVGQAVALTATVISAGTVNTGTVNFSSGGSTIASNVAVVNGVAQTTTSTLPAGADNLTAAYSGAASIGPSTGVFTETVIKNPLLVTTTADDTTPPPAPGGVGTLSLREAINLANQASGAQTITFDPTVFATPQTISLTQGSQLEISDNLTIDGPSVGVTISPSSSQSDFRIFQIDKNVTASMDLLTITGGDIAGNGGGIFVDSNSSLTLTNSTISSNTATGALGSGNGFGGGIDALGALSISGCLFDSNSASIDGGGINQDGAMSLVNSTFHGNSAGIAGGGINDNSPKTPITNCTFAGNSANGGGGINVDNGGSPILNNDIIAKSTSGHDLANGPATGSNNLIDDSNDTAGLSNTATGDPDLNAPANNGGPTFTMSLQPNSPAIDHGDKTLVLLIRPTKTPR